MNKNILIVAIIAISLLIVILLLQINTKGNQNNDFIVCLQKNNVVIYGTDDNCPACRNLLDKFSNTKNIDLIYVSCDKETERCSREMKTSSVPEIQINGELFDNYTIEGLSERTGCAIN